MYENVIIVPYRNRKSHLNIFLRDAVPLFRKYLSPFNVVIVEQTDGRLFNRGKILNIGYNEYKDKTKYIITHDVDICPKEHCVSQIYTKIQKTDIMGIYTSHWDTLGGIVKIDAKAFERINGFPNTYFGWGVEDKALQNRAETYNMTISKNILNNDLNRYDFFSILDDVADDIKDADFEFRTLFEYELFRQIQHSDKLRCCKSSGLNNLKYDLIEQYKLDIDIKWIKVDI